ncbi:MAG: aminopeptidase, partial [Oscillospiraceae bacterium]|nr:aminopeptidase [Oscillospiraceae bacterium]
MTEEKSPAKALKEKLCLRQKSCRLIADDSKLALVDDFCEGYKAYLNIARTERLAIKEAISLAIDKGFVEFLPGKTYQPGDKVYVNNRKKAAIFAIIGKDPVENGVNISAAHVDSPRLDLKPNPLYEDADLALL